MSIRNPDLSPADAGLFVQQNLLKSPSTDPGTARRTGRSNFALACADSRPQAPVKQLSIDAVTLDQPVNTILAGASALVASDAQHGQLADDVAECDRAIARHHIHPSTRNARSICAVAASMSSASFVCAARSNSSAAKSQCGDLLAPIYGWFAEGFDTPVLQDAKALLDELA
jgi:hypothetical protein